MKTIFALIFCLISSPVFAFGPAIQAVLTSTPAAAGGSGWFGTTGDPGASDDAGTASVICGQIGTPTCTGTCNVSKIALYHSSAGGGDIAFGIYTNPSGVPVAIVGTETRFPGGVVSLDWHEYNVDYTLTCGTSYYLCLNSEGDNTWKYEAANNRYYYKSNAYADAWPSTLSDLTGPINATISIKAYYTW